MALKLCFFPVLLSLAMGNSAPGKHPVKKRTKPQLTGHVHDKGNKPLAEAILKLYDCDATSAVCDKPPLGGARSLSDGTFVVEAKGLKPGVYTLIASMPPFYLARAKVPVFVPQDFGSNFDFVMQQDIRDTAGNLVGVSADDAKEIYAAARIERNVQVEALSAQIMNKNQEDPNGPRKETATQVAHAPATSTRPPGPDEATSPPMQRSSYPGSSGASTSAPNRPGSSDNSATATHTTSQGSSSSGWSQTITGCLSGSGGNYTLTDSASGTTYQLAGDTSTLSDLVGHHLRITGSAAGSSGTSVANASASGNEGRSGATSSASSSMGTGTISSSSGNRPASQTFNVQKVRLISSSCSSGK